MNPIEKPIPNLGEIIARRYDHTATGKRPLEISVIGRKVHPKTAAGIAMALIEMRQAVQRHRLRCRRLVMIMRRDRVRRRLIYLIGRLAAFNHLQTLMKPVDTEPACPSHLWFLP